MVAVATTETGSQTPHRRQVWSAVISVLVVAVVFGLGLPRFASYEQAWHRLRHVTRLEMAAMGVAAAWNLVSYWLLQMASLPGLTWRRAALATEASTAAANVLPAGAAISVGLTASMYRSWGFSADTIARSLVLSGTWNGLVKLATPLVAAALLLGVGGDNPPVAVGIVSVGALFMVLFVSVASLHDPTALGRVVGAVERRVSAVFVRIGRRPVQGWQSALERVRSASVELVGQRWFVLSLAAVVSHLSLFLVLAVTMAGIPLRGVSVLEALAAFAVVRVALILPLTPGGAGLAELGFTGLLVAAGAPSADAVAVVLVFRALTWLVQIPIGAVAYGIWLWEWGRS